MRFIQGTEPNSNTFSELTPEQKEFVQLPGYSPDPKSNINASTFTPKLDEGAPEKQKSIFVGASADTDVESAFAPLVTPSTFEADGLNTANVNPVDVASSLNASPMYSLAEDLSNSFSVEPDKWPIIPSDALVGDSVNNIGARRDRDTYHINIDGHSRMVSVISSPFLLPEEKTSTVIDGRKVPYHSLEPKREGSVQRGGNELIQEHKTLLKAKETFGLPVVEVEGFGLVDGERPAIIYRTDGEVSFHNPDMFVVSPSGTSPAKHFDSETLTRMGELRTEFEVNRLFTSNSTQGARNLNLLFQSENGVFVPKIIETPYIGSLNNAADLVHEDGTNFFEPSTIFGFDIRDPEDGVTKDLDTIDSYVQRIERTIR